VPPEVEPPVVAEVVKPSEGEVVAVPPVANEVVVPLVVVLPPVVDLVLVLLQLQ
jgi:hypothetical protein